MEEGSLRADVNVSVRKPGSAGDENRNKNLNSVDLLCRRSILKLSARLRYWKQAGRSTKKHVFLIQRLERRDKCAVEDAHDYRYFPDPDLLPLTFTQDYVNEIKSVCLNCLIRLKQG